MLSNTIPLTEALWKELADSLRTAAGVPDWILHFCSKRYDDILNLPDRLVTPGIAKPRLASVQKSSYVRIARMTRSTHPDAAEKHRRGVEAMERANCEAIVSLHIVKSDRSFHCYFEADSYRVVHFEEYSGQFIQWPRWKELILAWRTIALVTVILTVIAYLSSPTISAALVLSCAAWLFYMAAISTYGPRYSHVGIPTAIIIVLLGGLVWGAWLRAEKRIQHIERLRHAQPENAVIYRP